MGKVLGERIRQARLSAGFSQSGLARAISTRERNVQRWEAGENEPRAVFVDAIARVTGVKSEALFADEDDEESSLAADIESLEEALLMELLKKRLAAREVAK